MRVKRKPERKAHAAPRAVKVALSASQQLTLKMKEHKLYDADVAEALSPPASAAAVTRWRSGIRTPRRKVWRDQLFKMFKIPPPAWTDAEGKRAAWLAKNLPQSAVAR